ncbi:MAG: hypothetical protein KUL77_08590 [Thermomonas sp.]|uniref:hypothetical protein n=1 Tax=Thermomonas sp. TaxID=1971895 RepID=UPI001ED3C882|nr:hypothetical protein [Thermomonas sp.]MBV2209605.1 hypothetical protein [Thermomonas sp.]
MNWIAIVLIVIGVWLALKVAGAFLKLLLWAAAAVALWWWLHPYLGVPFLPF